MNRDLLFFAMVLPVFAVLYVVVDSHFMFPIHNVTDRERLEQVRQDLHDMGAEWDTEWKSTNQQLAERAEAAEQDAEIQRTAALEMAEALAEFECDGEAAVAKYRYWYARWAAAVAINRNSEADRDALRRENETLREALNKIAWGRISPVDRLEVARAVLGVGVEPQSNACGSEPQPAEDAATEDELVTVWLRAVEGIEFGEPPMNERGKERWREGFRRQVQPVLDALHPVAPPPTCPTCFGTKERYLRNPCPDAFHGPTTETRTT